MAVPGIQIRVGEDTTGPALERLIRVAGDPSAIMSAIAGFMVTASQQHIERETGPGGKWPRLSPRTANKRLGRSNRRRGYDHMLRVTGRLYSSITGDSGPDFAVVGTNLDYAAAQQLGAKIQMPDRRQDIHLSTGKGRRRFVRKAAKRKETRNVAVGAHTITIPARPFLYLTETEMTEILAIAAEGLELEGAQ
ncbi:phage virion morphogenesis protein [Aliihoeflea sp. PC F10.4]